MNRPAPARIAAIVAALLALGVLMVLVQLELIVLAFESLGLTRGGAAALFFACAVGSVVNVPLWRVRSAGATGPDDLLPAHALPWPLDGDEGSTVIAANLGGALIPGAFAAYLWVHLNDGGSAALLCIALVAAVSRLFSRVVPGVGVTMPVLLPPLGAAAIALWLDAAHAAPLAYIGGTLGTLLGADVLRLRETVRLRAPVASIGGAGTFDGIFLTGIVAVLLA